MFQLIQEKLAQIFSRYDDLLPTLPKESLSRKLGDLPSNTVWQQLWCVSGDRESYRIAIENDAPFRWVCSLPIREGGAAELLTSHLKTNAEQVIDALRKLEAPTDRQMNFAADLLTHEYQHQGQLIRYLYGNRLPIPNSWKEQWHL